MDYYFFSSLLHKCSFRRFYDINIIWVHYWAMYHQMWFQQYGTLVRLGCLHTLPMSDSHSWCIAKKRTWLGVFLVFYTCILVFSLPFLMTLLNFVFVFSPLQVICSYETYMAVVCFGGYLDIVGITNPVSLMSCLGSWHGPIYLSTCLGFMLTWFYTALECSFRFDVFFSFKFYIFQVLLQSVPLLALERGIYW